MIKINTKEEYRATIIKYATLAEKEKLTVYELRQLDDLDAAIATYEIANSDDPNDQIGVLDYDKLDKSLQNSV